MNTLFKAGLCFIATTLCLNILISLLSVWYSGYQIREQLQQQLPAAINDGLRNSTELSDHLLTYLQNAVQQDLAKISIEQAFPVIASCQVKILQLSHADNQQIATGNILTWNAGEQKRSIRYQLQCRPEFKNIFLFSTFLAGIATLILCSFPLLSAQQQQGINQLKALGLTQYDIVKQRRILLQLSPSQLWLLTSLLKNKLPFDVGLLLISHPAAASITAENLQWLLLGWRYYQHDTDAVYRVALSPDYLQFDLLRQQVIIHQLPIKLSRTPLLYYYWYALARQQQPETEGWVLNPASNRPDFPLAKQLIELMQQYHGHGKAITDLCDQGLKAKTLDQNRSKIKDELEAILGVALAEKYLFESRKDVRSGRFSYRLALSAEQIYVT